MNSEATFRKLFALCQIMLERPSGDSPSLSKEAISQTVKKVMRLEELDPSVDKERMREDLIAELEKCHTIFTPPHSTLESSIGHVPWLNQKRATISWGFWNRYELFLKKSLPFEVVHEQEKVIDSVLSRLEDPKREGDWDRRGLVMGQIQSGKTGNYCGLICKAADAGYKVIVVLSGLHNNLRSQTQVRLDEGFLGRWSVPPSTEEQVAFRPVGVGLITPSLVADSCTNRSQNGDFNRRFASNFGIHPGGKPLLFVVKKNTTVLNTLLRWIRSCASAPDPETGRRLIKNVPTLVIDDEADQASIDTRRQNYDGSGKPDPDHNPTVINGLIRKILRSFEKIAFVGYTATPFANIFIHNKAETHDLGPDLFPSSFIVNMPPPSNYIGAERTLGISPGKEPDGKESEPLPLIKYVSDHAETNAINEQHGWMPPNPAAKIDHRPIYKGNNYIPPSLREAVMLFILATAVRRLRESRVHHNSMLVHVTRYTNVQKLVAEQLEVALRELKQRLQYGDGGRIPGLMEEFKTLWNSDIVPKSEKCRKIVLDPSLRTLPEWTAVSPLLREVALSITVKILNGKAKDTLEYEEHRTTGLNVIAVGGDKLSRGLTLYGLTVSYFLRASRMYDTLMQMGRWFGYKDEYIDVCRLYTTWEIWEWFGHIAEASKELETEFQDMEENGATPEEYGLKVRSHPVMLVTARVKMRNGLDMSLSYSGDVSETIIFHSKPERILRNFSVTEDWLGSLGKPSSRTKTGNYLWSEVSAEKITDFLRFYSTHEGSYRANTNLLERYIKAQVENGELFSWTVQLCSNSKAVRTQAINDLSVGLHQRKKDEKAPPYPDRYSIRNLVSGEDELSDLSSDQWEEALRLTIERFEDPKRRGKMKNRPEIPGRREARSVRPKSHGLLLLYPLDMSEFGLSNNVKPIVGLAISFPQSATAQPITYKVNNVFVTQGGDYDSE